MNIKLNMSRVNIFLKTKEILESIIFGIASSFRQIDIKFSELSYDMYVSKENIEELSERVKAMEEYMKVDFKPKSTEIKRVFKKAHYKKAKKNK